MDKKQLQKEILEAPYERDEWLKVLREFFDAKPEVRQIPETITNSTQNWSKYVESAVALGKIITDSGNREIGIFEVLLTEKAWLERNRVTLRNLFKNIYSELDGALIVFTQGDKWRFSYVSEILIRDENDNVTPSKTEPKRFTYFFGDNENCRTAADRFDKLKDKVLTLADLNEAFSVEKLSKEFFKTYKDHFEKFWKYLANDESYFEILTKDEEDESKKPKRIRDFVKILLGRLVFLQFLQKKGWMGGTDWTNGDVKFVQNLFARFPDKNHFHSTALKTLFFETLNRKDRKNNLAPAILGEDIKIPYLNGGLFDKDISAEYAIDFPAEYFRELLVFFEQYNFTIDESDAFDREVGIDPEMLGHIFENLLEENREKGAFYTPKEIVHYMCQESLIEYLSTNLSEKNKADVESLVRHNFVTETLQNDFKCANEINDLLKRVKICDPAIGSGAFPMGLLKEIFECRRLLFAPARLENFNAANIKKEIIQNNIYGVDKEQGAVDTARLRFWLSLVVDEEEPQPLPNLDYKIMQGNSLLERFEDIDLSNLVSADSNDEVMVAETNQLKFDDGFAFPVNITIFDVATKEILYSLIDRFFDTDKWEREMGEEVNKNLLKKQINDIVEGKIHAHIFNEKKELENKISKIESKWREAGYTEFNSFNQNSREFTQYKNLKTNFISLDTTEKKLIDSNNKSEKNYFLWHLWFKDVFEKGGFDIVIGNPPYIQLQKLGTEADILAKANFQTFLRTGDIYCLFYEQSFNLLKDGGTICFITSSQWMRAAYGKPLRKYLSQQNPQTVINLGPGVFASATVDTNIFIGQKNGFQDELKGTSINGKDEFESLSESKFEPMKVDEYAWTIIEQNQKIINQSIRSKGKNLKDWKLKIYRGLLTGYNEAFLIDEEKRRELIKEDSKSSEIIKPLLRGRDIQRYKAEWANIYFINTHNGVKSQNIPRVNIDNYPAVKNHLDDFWNRLKVRADQGDTPYNLRNCAYVSEFSKEKVVWKRIGSIMRFSYSKAEEYSLDSTCIATGEKIKYLTALLNSRVSLYQLFESAPKTGMGDMIISVQALEPLLVYYPTPKEEGYFNILVDYLVFLYDKDKPSVNSFTDNKTIGSDFEEVINMMVYELYFEEHLKQKELDVIKLFDFEDISNIKTDEEKAQVINRAYEKYQERNNPIRNRILVSESRSPEIIRYINQNTY